MSRVDYMKRFGKFLLVIQILGLFGISGNNAAYIFTLSLSLLMAYFFFSDIKFSSERYLLSVLLHVLMIALHFIPAYYGALTLGRLIKWDT